jgi:uncharacterized protein
MHSNTTTAFDEDEALRLLKHYLPAQAPLKDFIHHNTLHAFQDKPFACAMAEASSLFGYQTYLTLGEYRTLYDEGRIEEHVLQRILEERFEHGDVSHWKARMLSQAYDERLKQKTGKLRSIWKNSFRLNMDKAVHPPLFRLTAAYLDQGISDFRFPVHEGSFLASVLSLESGSALRLFKSAHVRKRINESNYSISSLLTELVGEKHLFTQYLIDQQFAHPGWSGMACFLEHHPESLHDARTITLRDFVTLELLLELDFAELQLGETRKKLSFFAKDIPASTEKLQETGYYEVLDLWQSAMEWSYYLTVLRGMKAANKVNADPDAPTFQAICCIDDREESFRRYLEKNDPGCQTFGVAGFFNVPFYFQPAGAKFNIKSCPAPMTPTHLVKERNAKTRHKKDLHYHKRTHGLIGGMISSSTLGFAAAFKMIRQIFWPGESPAMVSAFRHIDPAGELSVEYEKHDVEGLSVGFTTDEMAGAVEGLLKTIGLTKDFAPVVYLIGHGASSINNTHFAGYDCGACSGRAGSANARIAALMSNRQDVRKRLVENGISIPDTTVFLGAIHDTTRDEIRFFDTEAISDDQKQFHDIYKKVIRKSLRENAVERARRFDLMSSKGAAGKIHTRVKKRAFSLFEPRPEWNHATNALCIVGRRSATRHLFLDRRAFLPSYDFRLDPDGAILGQILNAVAPVCGGINLEYYFSKVDNERLGAGSKLPHNVMGLIGVVNGLDGDLRTGLPAQMLNIHEPLRLLVIIEQEPELVDQVLKKNVRTKEWFDNEWIHLVAMPPDSGRFYRYSLSGFSLMSPGNESPPGDLHLYDKLNRSAGPYPVHLIR